MAPRKHCRTTRIGRFLTGYFFALSFVFPACTRTGFSTGSSSISVAAPSFLLRDVSLDDTRYSDGPEVTIEVDEGTCGSAEAIEATLDAIPPGLDDIRQPCRDIESFSLDPSLEGIQRVYLWARGLRGTVVGPSWAEITVDLNPPGDFAVTGFAPSSQISVDSYVTWSWQEANDGDGSGIEFYLLHIYTDATCDTVHDGRGYFGGSVNVGQATTHTFGPLPFGAYAVRIAAFDRVGRFTKTPCFSTMVSVEPADQFSLVTTGPTATNPTGAWGASFADINDDGALDLFVTTRGTRNYLYLNDGTGGLVEVFDDDPATDVANTGGPAFGDFDGDGHMDLVASNYYDTNNFLYFNDGAGSLVADRTSPVANDGGHNQGLVVFDIDSDHDLDILIAESNASGNLLYLNDGTGGFTSDTTSPLATDLGVTEGFALGDINLDGHLDVFVANSSARNYLFVGRGGGAFDPVTTDPVAMTSANTLPSAFADIDGDGDLDLFVGNQSMNTNQLYRNDGSGNFESIATGPVVTDVGDTRGAAFADVDCDGDLDLFVGNYGQPNQLYLNPGDGDFVRAPAGPTSETTENTPIVGFADLTGDGYVELFAGHDSTALDHLFVNAGGSNVCLTVRAVTDADGDASDADQATDRDAVGTHVWVDLDGDGDFEAAHDDLLLLQVVDSGDGDNRAGDGYRLQFGLGPNPSPPWIRARFPDGSEVTRAVTAEELAARQVVVRDPP